MVPFALIAVLLLIISMGIVYTLDAREDPETVDEQAPAIQLTEASAQAEFRGAVRRATHDAAAAPVTNPDDSPIGRALQNHSESAFHGYVELLVYRQASDALPRAGQTAGDGVTTEVYLPPADWSRRQDVRSAMDRVTLANVNSGSEGVVEATIDDVTVVAEQDGEPFEESTTSVTVSTGTTLFEFHEMMENYEQSLNGDVSGGSLDNFGGKLSLRLYALSYGKMYYDRLPIGSSGRAFGNVTPNFHTEVLANNAIFATQKEQFGMSDPASARVMRGPKLCMGKDIAEAVGDIDVDQQINEYIQSTGVNQTNFDFRRDVCQNPILFGNRNGQTDSSFQFNLIEDVIMPLFGPAKQNMTQEIYVHPIAEVGYFETIARDSVDDFHDGYPDEAVEQFHSGASDMSEALVESDRFDQDYVNTTYGEIDTEGNDEVGSGIDSVGGLASHVRDSDSGARTIDDVVDDMETVALDAPDPSASGDTYDEIDLEEPDDTANFTKVGPTYTNTGSTRVVDVTDHTDGFSGWGPDDLVSVEVAIDVTVTKSVTWEADEGSNRTDQPYSDSTTVEYTDNITVGGELAPDTSVNRDGRSGPFSPMQGDGTVVGAWSGAKDEALEEVFNTSGSIAGVLPDASGNSSAYRQSDWESDVREAMNTSPDDVQIDHDVPGLRETLLTDVSLTHANTTLNTDSINVSMQNMTTADPSPLRDFEAQVQSFRPTEVDGRLTGVQSGFVPLAMTEARIAYFDNVESRIDAIATEHENKSENIIENLNFELGFLNGIMNQVSGLVAGDLRTTPSRARGSELLGNVTYEINGHPTYLSQRPVNRSVEPAVRSPSGGTLELQNADSEAHAPLSVRYSNAFGHPGFPLLPWPPLFFVQADVWKVDVNGSYARFEISATSGDGASTDGITYVRQSQSVDFDGNTVGTVEPITFDTSTWIVGIVPAPQYLGGPPGVGNTFRYDSNRDGFRCSDTYDAVGPGYEQGDGGGCQHALQDAVDAIMNGL